MAPKTEYKHDELIHASAKFQFVMNHSTQCIDVRQQRSNHLMRVAEIDSEQELQMTPFSLFTADEMIEIGQAMKEIFKPEHQA